MRTLSLDEYESLRKETHITGSHVECECTVPDTVRMKFPASFTCKSPVTFSYEEDDGFTIQCPRPGLLLHVYGDLVSVTSLADPNCVLYCQVPQRDANTGEPASVMFLIKEEEEVDDGGDIVIDHMEDVDTVCCGGYCCCLSTALALLWNKYRGNKKEKSA